MARSPKSAKQIDALTHDAASRRNIPTAEMESFFRRDEDASPLPPKHYARARPLAEGERRTAEEPRRPELIWNGARIAITEEQMAELASTGTLTLSDAQLVWRAKDRQDWSDLVVNVPPLYIQEKIHPKAIIDSLRRYQGAGDREQGTANREQGTGSGPAPSSLRPAPSQPDLFSDFNGITPEQRAEFYQHDQHWSNRMILGDSLQVMASLAERESLRGKVQCIYFDPPYGIKFNSNWQVSTQSRDVKDGKQTDISREPEQVKAFRDTWKDGIHSYLTYLRDRLTVMRDLLTESGSIFVQIGDENVHRVRAVMDEVFGADNFVSQIVLKTTSGAGSPTGGTVTLASVHDFVLWFSKTRETIKYRQLYFDKADMQTASLYRRVISSDGTERNANEAELAGTAELPAEQHLFRPDNLTSQSSPESATFKVNYRGLAIGPGKGGWKTNPTGMKRLIAASRLYKTNNNSIQYQRRLRDFNVAPINDIWGDVGTGSFTAEKLYVVQTNIKVVQRCILMATDPGDLVLDPTCGSGTTAYVAEQWGRRWITIDTSRVALALARTRLMAARYPWYLLADSAEGWRKERELSGKGGGNREQGAGEAPHSLTPPPGSLFPDLRQGFVYERVPHITLKSIANNPMIDGIWERWQAVLEPLRAEINAALGTAWEEWEVPRELGDQGAGNREQKEENPDPCSLIPDPSVRDAHRRWWESRIARQREIDASIAARADVEYLYDKPYADASRVRVAGPFTVESLSPHRVLPASEGELIDEIEAAEGRRSPADADLAGQDFSAIVIDYLKSEGVKQQDKGDRIAFESLTPWPGRFIGAAGTFLEGAGNREQGAGKRQEGSAGSGEREHPAPSSLFPAPSPTSRRAAILIGPEYGTIGRQDIVAAAREAVDARFDVLIACAFNFDAHSSELGSLGSLKILKARINPDMHMSEELKNTGRGNMFVVFGEPDVTILDDGGADIRVKVNGVDVFDPNTGDIRSNDTKGIAAWFIDTAYNEESFFVRHAYFLGANDPYKNLKTALQAEIDEEAWATLYSDTSRPFPRPEGGKIAVKVINHFGDEVMKVFGV